MRIEKEPELTAFRNQAGRAGRASDQWPGGGGVVKGLPQGPSGDILTLLAMVFEPTTFWAHARGHYLMAGFC